MNMKFFPYSLQEINEIAWKPVLILCSTAFCLACIHFFSPYYQIELFERIFNILGKADLYKIIHYDLYESDNRQFWQLLYWSMHTILFYFLVPVLLIKFVFKEKLSKYGLKVQGLFSYARIYIIAFILILPIVVWVSYSAIFQYTYPFFVPLNEADFFPYLVTWELFYILQFFALEFFFRGFMVQGLKEHFGIYAVFVMIVPYCMIHFTKPMPECIGSIFAGIFLGLMSYKTNSIWLGAMLHVAVAMSMDLLSLWHKGYF